MKTKNMINFNRFSNKGFSSFMNDVMQSLSTVTPEEVNPLKESFTDNVSKFNDYVTNLSESEARSRSSELRRERGNLFNNFRKFVRSLQDFPDESISGMGREVWNVLKDFCYISKMDTPTLSGTIIHSLKNIHEIVSREEYTETYVKSGLDKWVIRLESLQSSFDEASQVRVDERQQRLQESSKDLRDECIKSFNLVYSFVNCLSETKGDESCKDFVGKVDVFLKETKMRYQMREKLNKKKREEMKDGETTLHKETSSVESQKEVNENVA